MKTRIDSAIAEFAMDAIDSGRVGKEKLQALLDFTREQFGLDSVYILEKVGADNLFAYKCVSFSRPEYDNSGMHLRIPKEEWDAMLKMYDMDLVCDHNLPSIEEKSDFSNCIIHYGFVRKKLKSYDGSIGFQLFSPHIWTREEKEALKKLGTMYKAILSISLAEGVNEHLFQRLRLEQIQYREALFQGSECGFSFDLTDGWIRERVITSGGKDLMEELGLAPPQRYEDFAAAFAAHYEIFFLDKKQEECFTCRGLISRYERGEFSAECEFYYPDKDAYYRITIYLCRDEESGHIYALFTASDISDARRLEITQRQALKAAYDAANQANNAKTRFLSNMSHDIRTPMNGIIGMTAIAGAYLDDRNRVADCLKKITVSSKHLLGIINEVLDMSKIESGKIDLQDEAFSLSEFMEDLLTISKPQLSVHNHDFSVSINGVEHEKVIGDSQRLKQVFTNLLSNAAKYTPDGGKIRLTIAEKPTDRPKLGCYEFVFEDNGIGMSEQFLKHLYEPFMRADDDSRVSQIQGTGLGMAITKAIIQMMNGTIKVESQPDKGTKFTVTIILKLQDVDESVSYERFVDLPILVADDDETACESTCMVLGELGMKGEWVTDGQTAVDRVVKRHKSGDDYFAIILDWKMPGMDGVDTTREIRRRVGDDVPIIIISAYDWSEIELAARSAGATAFVSKPLFKSRLAHLFHNLLNEEKPDTQTATVKSLHREDYNGRRALLVEDNELNAEIAGEILSMIGLKVEYAKDGKQALDKVTAFGAGHYDIIFMDIQMPVMNGYEAACAIRALPDAAAKSIPIVAMTANAFAEDALAAKEAGMNEHIAKPIDSGRILKTLKRWLGAGGDKIC